MKRGQAERLMPLLEEVLAEAGCGWDELDAVGVGVGPGNFTGIRISVSAARGLALGLGVPAVGVSMFELYGGGDPTDGPFAGDDIKTVICLSAPRGCAYVQALGTGGWRSGYRLVDPEAERLAPQEQKAWGEGPAAGLFDGQLLFRRSRKAFPPVPLAVRIGRGAAAKLAKGAEGIPRPAPLYVRAADAAPPREAAPVILDG